MDTFYMYSRMRPEFGKQCVFWDRGPELIDNYMPQKNRMEGYIFEDPYTRGTMLGKQFALHEVNTERIEYENRVVSHMEGGWPRDVNYTDIEQTTRFRKKCEKDDNYIHAVLNLSHRMEHCINQNNAIDIYQQYYSDVEPTPIVEKSNCRTVNVYRPPAPLRPITNLSWSPDNGSHLAVTHCNMVFQGPPSPCHHCYIWDLENPNTPQMVLQPDMPVCFMEYMPKDWHVLNCALWSGQVGFFDTRRGPTIVNKSLLEHSHREPCNRVLWITSKTGTEFFSSSTDGMLRWWDTRKLSEPTDMLILDLSKSDDDGDMTKALAISTLEFEPTMTTRFMVGTDTGMVVACNRKGKSRLEKLAARFNAHLGPVYAIQRNGAFLKNFLTIGDWTARIWAEDCKESCIIWTAYHKSRITDACWSAGRYSIFFLVREDGIFDTWDILQQQNAPILSVKASDYPLTRLRTHEDGRLICLGNNMGTTYLVEVSENMILNQPKDKPFLTAMFDREAKREKIIDSRMRELKLKMTQQTAQHHATEDEDEEGEEEQVDYFQEPVIVTAEKEYFDTVDFDLAKYGMERKVVVEEEPPPPVEEPKGKGKKK